MVSPGRGPPAVPAGVKHSEDCDVLGVIAERHDGGEPADERAPNRAIDASGKLRRSGNSGEGGVDAAQKVVPEPFALVLAPVPRGVQLRAGLRADPERLGHRRIRTCSRAVSHGVDASGCAS